MSEEPKADVPRIEITVAAPVSEVWEAMRDKEKIRHWHGWEYDGLEQEIDVIFFTDYVEDGHTLNIQGGDVFRLEPDGTGTRITLTRAPKGTSSEWDAYYDDITEGWITFLQQLKFALERHPGQTRRTLFYSGDGPAVPVTGETWFRSDNQHGVVVPEWGDGLVISAYNPKKNQAMAVLTTYGLSETEFAQLSDEWAKRWAARPA